MREGKTNYRTRLRLLSSGKPRFVVRRKLNNMVAQVVAYGPAGDTVAVASTTQELKKYGWSRGGGNTPASYLAGLLLGRKALKAGVKEAVFDRGRFSGERVYAALKGAVDSGFKIPHSAEIFPKEERISGKHIKAEKEFEGAKKRILEN